MRSAGEHAAPIGAPNDAVGVEGGWPKIGGGDGFEVEVDVVERTELIVVEVAELVLFAGPVPQADNASAKRQTAATRQRIF